jgi:4-hydroxybenzoate polyprenyltransferase
MTRPGSLVSGLIAIPGWLAASGSTSVGRLAALVGAMMGGRAGANVLTDIFDREKDRVTAPELPLPSGLVTVRQAIGLFCFIVFAILLLLALASETLSGFLLGLAGFAFGGISIGIYSFVKPYAWMAVTVTGFAYLSAPLAAWLVAGGGWSAEAGIVFVYAMLYGAAANVFSTLRDVDKDGQVGNFSIAVRLGPAHALKLGLSLQALTALCVFGIALLVHRFSLGLLVLFASLAMIIYAYVVSAQRQELARSRHERFRLMWPVDIARQNVGPTMVQSPTIGIAAALLFAVGVMIEVHGYVRRINDGGLLKVVARRRGSEPASAPVISAAQGQ